MSEPSEPMTGHRLEAQMTLMTRLAEDAIATSRTQHEQMTEVRLHLQKISQTQDTIAERMGKGEVQFASHDKRLTDLETGRTQLLTSLAVIRWFSIVGWGFLGAIWTGLLALLGYLYKGHAS